VVKNYEKYRDIPGITTIGICMSTTATVKTMAQQVERFSIKPFANMLDAGGATMAAYGVPKNSATWLILIDGEGKIAYNDAGMGWRWTGGPNTGKTVFETQLEESFKKSKHLLSGVSVPAKMATAAHYYDLQQFELLDRELAKADAKDTPQDVKDFAGLLRGKVTEHRKLRAEQIQKLAESNPVQAHRDATAFVDAYPKAPETSAIKTLAGKLMVHAKVRRELQAESAYQLTMVPEMKKVTNTKAFNDRIQPMLEGYLKTFADTQFAEVVKNAVEAHRLALSKF